MATMAKATMVDVWVVVMAADARVAASSEAALVVEVPVEAEMAPPPRKSPCEARCGLARASLSPP